MEDKKLNFKAFEETKTLLLKSLQGQQPANKAEHVVEALDLAKSIYEKHGEWNEANATHLVNVAQICLNEIGLGSTSATAALLHETIERKWLTPVEMEKRFGQAVASILMNFTQISGLDPKDPKTEAELFRQMLISLTSDARVILIKLADRLDTMRSLSKEQPEVRLKRSWETFHLYAPLAHRLGLYRLKSEMEDLAMKYIYPKEYKYIIKRLQETTASRNRFLQSFISPIENELQKKGFTFTIKGRTKSIYSIFRKMQNQEVDFDEVHDIFAIRIILDSKPENEKSDCWQVYSIITDKYTPNTERLRDWISVPKSNGYESLHTTVLGPDNKWIEVQIRTVRMDEIAEKGLAAHWKYKGIRQEQGQEQGIDEWVVRVREILESPDTSPEDKVEQFQMNLTSSDIYVFTPKGDIRKLPAKSTVLDFAFDIHTEVGSQCVGAIVNGKNTTIKQELQNGDVVEILTSKKQKPKKDWLTFIITSKAKSRIKQQLRDIENREIQEGREILLRRLKNWKIDDVDEAIRKVNKHLKLKKPTDIFILIAQSKVDLTAIKTILTAEEEKPAVKEDTPKPEIEKAEVKESSDYLVIDEKLVNIEYKLAKCCNPIFGDDIFGFVTVNEGIKIHRTSCPNAGQLKQRWPYRVVKARWKGSSIAGAFQTTIKVSGIDEIGILNRISEVISKDLRVNMRNLNVSSRDGLFEAQIQLYVEDTKHLKMLLYRLSRVQGVHKTVRMK
ncbi:MAG TPA: bifunctional (p)ppGpp synthetase/guanosine-3',5'-bis(diphosphate) 3'-pyrophosphohydrolase [Bacteroidales bacterium]|nr:bifunctional (p)ppGpp synthetase/guanosine-3',5'-bis(diphosphate) 3'-pyrophosphohydrolase [Bacteroidales bacterium]